MSKINKIKKQATAMKVMILGFAVLILLNLAGWSIYLALHEFASVTLEKLGVVNYIVVNIIIAVSCVAVAVVISKKPLGKAIKEVLD